MSRGHANLAKAALALAIAALVPVVGCGSSASGSGQKTADTAGDAAAADLQGDVTGTADAVTPTALPGIWTQIKVPGDPAVSLHGVWTDGPTRSVAVGSDGTILQNNGLGWKVASAGVFPTLHAVSGAPGGNRVFAVGLGGTIVQNIGAGGQFGSTWGPPGGCTKAGDCNDGDPCTADSCESGLCSHLPAGGATCCGGSAFADSFDKGLGNWTVSDTSSGGIVWSAASMKSVDGTSRYTSAPNAAYFGRTDAVCPSGEGFCPTFDNGKTVASTMISPAVQLPSAKKITLSFMVLLDVGSGIFDQLQIQVAQPSGAKEVVWDKQKQLTTGSTGGQFVAQTADLTKFAGQKIHLEISFNSLDKNNNAGEGVYLDDLAITSQCNPPAATSGSLTSSTLFSVWAAGDDDAWAVGEGGFTAHWDGTAWTAGSGSKTADYDTLGGSSHFALLGGTGGFLAQVSAGGVKGQASGTQLEITATAVRENAEGTAIAQAMAVGTKGLVLYFDGSVWKKDAASPLAGQDLRGVAAFGDGTWAAVSSSGNVWQRNVAGTWEKATSTGLPLYAVVATGKDTGYAMGLSGALAERNGDTWQVSQLAGGGSARAAWADDKGNGWAVGDGGSAWKLEQGNWNTAQTGMFVTLQAVWAAAPDDVFAAGQGATIIHYDGTAWTPMAGPVAGDWRGLWGNSSTDVYAVGTGGAVAHWNGQDWSLLSEPVTATLRAVWGLSGSDIWAVGEGGNIYHYSGLGWKLTPIEPYQPDPNQKAYKVKSTLLAVWGPTSGDVWASGEPDGDGRGVLVHWDGQTWTYAPLLQEWGHPVRAIWGWGPADILLAGTGGGVLHLDSTTSEWKALQTGTIATLFGIAPFAKDALLVGDIGVVLRYTPPVHPSGGGEK